MNHSAPISKTPIRKPPKAMPRIAGRPKSKQGVSETYTRKKEKKKRHDATFIVNDSTENLSKRLQHYWYTHTHSSTMLTVTVNTLEAKCGKHDVGPPW